MATPLEIRPPAVGGIFYPGSAPELAAEVRTLLAAVPARAAAPGLLKALIVPHAGLRYSGPVAASAYALLRRRRDEVYPEDVQDLAKYVLGHRVWLGPHAASHGVTVEMVINDVVDRVPVP